LHLPEVSRVVKVIEKKVEWWLPGLKEGGERKLFKEEGISILLEEQFQEICCTNYTPENGGDGTFYVIFNTIKN
jgi:hypothetical protein